MPFGLILKRRAEMPFAKCKECARVFDLLNEDEAGEYYYGHDCEPLEEEMNHDNY